MVSLHLSDFSHATYNVEKYREIKLRILKFVKFLKWKQFSLVAP